LRIVSNDFYFIYFISVLDYSRQMIKWYVTSQLQYKLDFVFSACLRWWVMERLTYRRYHLTAQEKEVNQSVINLYFVQ